MSNKPRPIAGTREVRLGVPAQKFEIRKNEDGSRSIAGYAATFGDLSHDLGGWREKIAPGAFTASLKDATIDPLCLYGHDMNNVLGRVSSGTLTIAEDSRGLKFECRLPDTSVARDLIALMERRDISKMSFGFSCDSDAWDEVGDEVVRTLLAVTLWEVSVVYSPAYESSSVNLRSASASIRARLESRSAKTKKVDGVELAADCFAYVGDSSDPETWNLPIRFPGDEGRTVSAIKDALAGFDETEGIPTADKSKVYDRIVDAAKEHGIHVQDSEQNESKRDDDEDEDDEDEDGYDSGPCAENPDSQACEDWKDENRGDSLRFKRFFASRIRANIQK